MLEDVSVFADKGGLDHDFIEAGLSLDWEVFSS